MGKRGRGKKGGGNNNRSSGGGDRAKRERIPWPDLVKGNEKFEQYYKMQGIARDDEDWNQALQVFKKDLPTTFRVTGHRGAKEINTFIKNTYLPFLQNIEHDGEKLEPPKLIPWYPEGLGWQVNVSKAALRKNAEFKKFHNFLVYETDAGNLSRQEAVSMIPPLLLDVQPHHHVLDMCAAPGSKTAQLLEAIHSSEANPDGLLIANDSDYKRCHMLVHQSLNRIGSPNMMVTNLDASNMPTIYPSPKNTSSPSSASSSSSPASQHFDRILADVPCSGDGTLRKNLEIWRVWGIRQAVGIHSLQLRILHRAFKLLKPGGRMVYSTCSLNPIENEAVLNAGLREFGDQMKLLPTEHLLPGLIRRPGLTDWKVINTDNFEAVDPPPQGEKSKVAPLAKNRNQTLPASLWPDSETHKRGLEQCMRIMPHDQDTGGFFVALLEKRADVSSDQSNGKEKHKKTHSVTPPPESESKRIRVDNDSTAETTPMEVSEATTLVTGSVPETELELEDDNGAGKDGNDADKDTTSLLPKDQLPANPKTVKYGEAPYTYLPEDHEEIQRIVKFLDLLPEFPKDRLLVRNVTGEPVRSMYLTSLAVKKAIQGNSIEKIRPISCGVKVFSRQDHHRETFQCKWRIMSEGLEALYPYLGPGRKVSCNLAALKMLIGPHPYPRFDDFKEVDINFRDGIAALENGSAVVEVRPAENEDQESLQRTLVLVLWKTPQSISLMVERKERTALSLRIFGEDLTPPKIQDGKKTHVEQQKQDVQKEQEEQEEQNEKETPAEAEEEVEEDEGNAL